EPISTSDVVASPEPAAAAASAPLKDAPVKLSWKLKYAQVGQTTSVKVAVDPSVLAKASKVTVTAKMKYGRKTTRTVTCGKSLTTLVDGAFACNLKDYGKWSITATFHQGRKKVRTNKAVSFGVVADEYVIAPLGGTLPGTMFTTSLWGADSIRGAGENRIPVIARLTRAHQWDWRKLPDGVYAVPYLTAKQTAARVSLNSYKSSAIAPIKAYIKDLRKLNKKSVFHLYVNDYTAHLVHNLLYANKIPQDRYTITFLSDGTHSYNQFAKNYGGKNPAAQHKKLIELWNKAKATSYKDGKPHLSGTKGRAAIYAAVDVEPSAKWWLGRPALLNPNAETGTFAHAAQTSPKVVGVNLGAKLTALRNQGAQAVKEFKALYRFNDAYFADAIKSKKQVMLFLGTTLVNNIEKDFSDYAGFAVKYYGKKYGYYYKGHPASPTENYPAKQKELKKLGLTDVQASVPAELILFFNPGISMSGYDSTTWASVPDINPDMAEGLFGLSKAAAADKASYYPGIMKWYMSPKPASGPAKDLPGDFLVEFSDKVAAEKGHDIAMWGSKKKTITYYKLVDGKYTKVS
ncbi:MAG: hypothetical protein KIT69_10275, partial [Propionibacteriaceae bacterium]|nr:hypothetical protein [Propionibacteriaceae bacterium]